MRYIRLLLVSLFTIGCGTGVKSNFTTDAVVYWNGTPLSTRSITSNQLMAALTDSDLMFWGMIPVYVRTGGMNSKDYKEAAKWYRKAAEHGYTGSLSQMGLIYEYGRGVTPDYVQAHMWYNLAAASGQGEFREKVAGWRDALAAKMTPEQIAEAQRMAREWTPVKAGGSR